MKIIILSLTIILVLIMLFCMFHEPPPHTSKHKEYYIQSVKSCIAECEKMLMIFYKNNKQKTRGSDIVICRFSHTSEREKATIQVYNGTALQFLDEMYIDSDNAKQHTKVIHGLYDLIHEKYGDNIWLTQNKFYLKNEKYLVIYKKII